MDWLFGFSYYYPLFMTYLWMTGAVFYYFNWERNGPRFDQPPELDDYPPVSIIVPCHNEGENARETIGALAKQNYPEFEIIAVNDGSSDDTGRILDELAGEHERLRVLHFASNQGKAMGLNMGALAARHEFLVCIDGDALLDPNVTRWFMRHLVSGPRVGAVTGNPRIRTRSTLLGKIQVGEFSSIIGMIKRAQRVYGRVFTISGVVAAFRKSALHRVGYWDTDMITEDIDISWKLQLDHWDVRYEPNALCWILMPETLKGLWKQRLRWAQGGAEVFMKSVFALRQWRWRRMWPVFLEYATSVIWSYLMAGIILLWALGKVIALPPSMQIPTLIPGWNGIILGITCFAQFGLSLAIDSRYEQRIGRYFFWMVWYPMAYWVINVATAVVAVPKAILRPKGKRAIWVSPDRGLRPCANR